MKRHYLLAIAILVLLGTGTAQAPTVLHLSLVGSQAAIQDDVLSAAGDWTFSVKVTGHVSALGLKIKNNPGAAGVCWSYYKKFPQSGTVVAVDIPKASLGACGSTNRWPDTNGDPLTVYAYTQGSSDADVEIDVIYPTP